MSKLDPDLLRVVERHREPRATGSAGRGSATGRPQTVSFFVEFSGPIDDLVALGFQPHTVLRDPAAGTTIATGHMPADAIEQLVDIEHVKQVESAQPMSPLLDVSLPAAHITPLHGPPYSYQGEGVVVGIIDREIDIFHETFQKANKKSRILALWNQVEVRPPGYNNPATPFGVEYLRADIDGFLKNPSSAEPISDRNPETALGGTKRRGKNHGTWVAGIAAGSGSPEVRDSCGRPQHEPETGYVGAAPQADIVVVARRQGGNQGTSRDDPSSTDMMAGLDYIFNKAGNRPAVVNISGGFRIGPHDGTSLFERSIDNLLQNGTQAKRAIVVASGNEATAGQHTSRKVAAGGQVDLVFGVPSGSAPIGTRAENKVERLQVWFDAPDGQFLLEPTLLLPASATGAEKTVLGPLTGEGTVNVKVFGEIDVHMLAVRYENKLCVDIRWAHDTGDDDDPWLAQKWVLRLRSKSSQEISVDGWFNSIFGRFDPAQQEPSRTLMVPATAKSVITVGSYAHKTGQIANTSSYGATRDGRPKPDVVAPGVGVVSAKGQSAGERLTGNVTYRCCQCCCSEYEITPSEYEEIKSGTSFAAPHVAGLIALMFQAKDDLTSTQIKDILRDTAVPPDGVTANPTDPPYGQWGWGRINGVAAIDRVRQLLGPGGGRGISSATGGGVATAADSDGAAGVGDERDEGGASASVPATARAAARPGTGDHGILHTALGALGRLDDPVGARWAALVSRYFSEVRGLIFHRRRVALYWHRMDGPALVRGLTHEFGGHPAWARPPVPDAVRFAGYLDRFLDELDRLGSAGLRREVRHHRPLLRLATPETLLSVLTAGTSATDTAA